MDAKGRADARQGVRTASLALLAGAIGVIGAVYTARTFALNRAGQLTDRFTKAIEQLGHQELDVRLGGIYALERIARDSKEDHPQVFEILTAFVREHAPQRDALGLREDTGSKQTAADVQAVLTVVGRRRTAYDDEDLLGLDFSSTYLPFADLSKAHVSDAHFTLAYLRHARFTSARLRRAHFIVADLREASLAFADLRDADLSRADLRGAELRGSHLSGADLEGAQYDEMTRWPRDFGDPEAAGATRIGGAENPEPRP